MNYHGITHTSFNHGEGMRVVVFVSGCEHKCEGCRDAYSWNSNGSKPFDKDAEDELFRACNRTWVDGVTFAGGDPFHPDNIDKVTELSKDFKKTFPDKTIWLYTGYTYEYIKNLEIMKYVDVVVDCKYNNMRENDEFKFISELVNR